MGDGLNAHEEDLVLHQTPDQQAFRNHTWDSPRCSDLETIENEDCICGIVLLSLHAACMYVNIYTIGTHNTNIYCCCPYNVS